MNMNTLRLCTTALVILHAVSTWPRRQSHTGPPESHEIRRNPDGCRFIGPADIRACLGNLGKAVDLDGELALFFPDCSPLAAPFLLFRLKRTGFSGCRAVITGEGLSLHGTR
jgi:hypothetical protein